jgi:tetratricopeptide (TPR) repeat protein
MEGGALLLKIMDCMSSHRYTWPLAYYDGILKTDPGNVTALNNKGCFLAYLGYLAESVRAFDKILAMEQDNLTALSNKAAVLQVCGLHEGELDLLLRILGKDPSNLGIRVRCINLLTRLGRYEEALRCHREMPRPGAMTYMLLGSVSEDFRTLRRYQECSPTIEIAVKLMEEYRAGKNRHEDGSRSQDLHLALL